MSYFDSTPLGRIINRFTEDTAHLDTSTYQQLSMALFTFGNLISLSVGVFVYVPWTMLIVVPLLLIAVIFLSFYRASAREVKRYDALYRSAMLTHVSETLSGLSTVVAYHREGDFLKKLDEKIDNMNSAFFITAANQSWLTLRLTLISSTISFMATILSSFRLFHMTPSSAGLILNLLPGMTECLVFLMPAVANLENEMNSVERLYDFGNELPMEAALRIEETKPAASWPENGAIEFRNATLRYRPTLPNVLNDITLSINGGEKIGICGRTGAGKSTILTALFRLNELSEGSIIIDGVDISKIGLHDLRNNLSIIPQDPVLFQGTIRSNLDPFGERTDVELFDALRRSGLITVNEMADIGTSSHKFHLDEPINDEGTNFSLGERQLLTLARALVRQSRILVLDEATATVDYETDKKVQDIIVSEFSDSTILCVAHRLNTIIRYDRILVLDAGSIAELDTPYNLYMKRDSIFRDMCVKAGITMEDFAVGISDKGKSE